MKRTTSLLLIAICVLIMFASPLGGRRPTATTSPVTNTRRDLVTTMMLSLLCAGLFALSLSGCAEEADIYSREYRDTPEYRYNIYYGPDYYPYYPYYGYYGGAYY